MSVRRLFDELTTLAWMPDWAKDRLAAEAALRQVGAGEVLVRQHDEARTVSFVLSGSVSMMLSFEDADPLLVDQDPRAGQILGWSAFRPPYRYSATVRAETPCSLVVVPRAAFQAVVAEDRGLEYHWLRRVAGEVGDRIARTADRLSAAGLTTSAGVTGNGA